MLDFTDPATGKAASRVCFIGRNGTGKTTVLRQLEQFLRTIQRTRFTHIPSSIELELGERLFVFSQKSSDCAAVFDLANAPKADSLPQSQQELEEYAERHGGTLLAPQDALAREIHLDPSNSLLAFMSAEAKTNQALHIEDVPATKLNDALALMKQIPYHHQISTETVQKMWQMLVYLVKRRESDRQDFELRHENLSKTKQQLIDEFDNFYPDVLDKIAELWDPILEPAGLEFDRKNAKIPVQLSENLKAYVRLRGTGERIQYSDLATGIRNVLFNVGYLFLLYFNRKIEHGLVLIDEPENSLFPDFLFELMTTLDRIVGDQTQMFVATHSPIVAAQFEPHERIILEFDDERFVTAAKGSAPKGDDPNDVLLQDFRLPEVMGPAGRDAWSRYVELRQQIRRKRDSSQHADLEKLLEQAADLGRRYGFVD